MTHNEADSARICNGFYAAAVKASITTGLFVQLRRASRTRPAILNPVENLLKQFVFAWAHRIPCV